MMADGKAKAVSGRDATLLPHLRKLINGARGRDSLPYFTLMCQKLVRFSSALLNCMLQYLSHTSKLDVFCSFKAQKDIWRPGCTWTAHVKLIAFFQTGLPGL